MLIVSESAQEIKNSQCHFCSRHGNMTVCVDKFELYPTRPLTHFYTQAGHNIKTVCLICGMGSSHPMKTVLTR